ncbi:hypothetical protein E1264_36115 [Actinomadura sp. KC216]|uniref:hypothetical protein n=1 Tax=Actinomadura sp. KC216 TaxID=2530370 RepID=UPI00104BF568|nr:hypothetical protein [Actinomadura sp. KC216]TDB79020.1 hypothetical protein E1264_36115 [Actinomadura sp. KC216]
MTGMIGRRYLDAGDRLSGRKNPPEVVTVLTRWGAGGGPRNVLVRRADGSREVIPFPRRLRRHRLARPTPGRAGGHQTDLFALPIPPKEETAA